MIAFLKSLAKGTDILRKPLSETTLTEIYEQDYYLWLLKTLELVKNKDVNELDWEHLTEEIEALGNEQRRKVKSYLRQLLIHLLLYYYWENEKTILVEVG